MECNYEPYIKITGTTTFPPIRCRSFTKACELESLFQREKCYDKLSRDRGRRRYCKGKNTTGGLGAGGGGGGYGHHQSTMTPNEYATRCFHERYSGLAPKAFCLYGPDGSTSLCLDRKEFEAIVERSRNKNSDCSVVLCTDFRDNEDLDDDDVRRSPLSLTECPCRRSTRDRPGEPPTHRPDPCRGRVGRPGPRVKAGATTKAAASVRWKTEKKNGAAGCLRGSCGRPMKCPSQTYNKIPRSTRKPNKGRLPPLENNSCDGSKINQPSCGCCCCCCHRMIPDSDPGTCTPSTSSRFKDSSCCRATAVDSERIRSKGCCTGISPSGSQANRGNFLPPVCCSDSRRTRLQPRPFNLDACDDVRPNCGSNVYVIRPADYAKIDYNRIRNATCTVGEKTFKLSAM